MAHQQDTTVYSFNGTQVTIVKDFYANGRLALLFKEMSDGEGMLRLTTNFPKTPIPEGYAFIKNYSENDGVYQWLLDHKIIENSPQPSGIDREMWPLAKILI